MAIGEVQADEWMTLDDPGPWDATFSNSSTHERRIYPRHSMGRTVYLPTWMFPKLGVGPQNGW